MSIEPVDLPGERTARARKVGPFTFRHLAVIGAAALGTAALLMLLTRPIAGPSVQTAPAPGASFYRIGEAGTGLAIGDRPPPLSTESGALVDLEGRVVDIAAIAGQPVWVVFWASWCPPCQQETPDLQRAYEANRSAGLEIIAVNVEEPPDIVAGYAQAYGLSYTIALDPTAATFRSWGVFGLPTHYFIGRDGRIRNRWFGPLSLAQMQQQIDVIAAD